MALDSGIAKMGIFAFVLLVAFAGIISIIPIEFVNAVDYGNPADKIPETWNGIEIGGYNFTDSWNTTLTTSSDTELNDVGGRNLRLSWIVTTVPYNKYLQISHRYGFLLILNEDLEWYNTEGERVDYMIGINTFIGYEELNENFEEYSNLEFETICKGLGSGSSYFKLTVLYSLNHHYPMLLLGLHKLLY